MFDLLIVVLIVTAAAFMAGWWLRRAAAGQSCHDTCGVDAHECPLAETHRDGEPCSVPPEACCGKHASEEPPANGRG